MKSRRAGNNNASTPDGVPARLASRHSPNSPQIAAVLEHIASGMGIRKACKAVPGAPQPDALYALMLANPELAERYARARELQATVHADQIIELADECRMGEKIERTEAGRECSVCHVPVLWQHGAWRHKGGKVPLCEGGVAEKVYVEKIVTGDMTERSRLQIDARKWIAAKHHPKVYARQNADESGGSSGGGGATIQLVIIASGSQNELQKG